MKFVLFFLFFTYSLFAHEDDTGEVHPVVKVEGGDFVIYSLSNLSFGGVAFRTVYNTRGYPVRVEEVSSKGYLNLMVPRVNGPHDSFVLKAFGSNKYFVPTVYEENDKSIIYQREGEKWIEKGLNTEAKELTIIKAAAVSKKNIIILEQTNKQIYVDPNYELHFRLKIFDREKRKC